MAEPALLTDHAQPETVAGAPEPLAVRSARSALSSGWVPASLVLVATALTLRYYGVSARDIAAFAGYSALCITLPGTLLWRAVQGRSGILAFDLAIGTTVGFAIEIPVYALALVVGVPIGVVAWPIVVIALFIAVPRLRRHWRGSAERLPAGTAWSIAVALLYFLAAAGLEFFRTEALRGAAANAPMVDMPFQIGMLGDLKHHMPPTTLWVSHTPLQYHWYVYAHGAAASWITGIEPQVLILRLLPLAMIAAFVVTVVAIAHRLTGRWWVGSLALLLMLIGPAASPFGWSSGPTFSGTIMDNIWASPTQTFAATLCTATLFIMFGLFRDRAEARRPINWIALTVMVGALAGAKATFVPMLVCGLVFAVAVRFVTTRRFGPELPALGVLFAWMAFAQFVLYGGGDQGMVVSPLQTVKWTPLGIGILGSPTPASPVKALVILTLLSIVGCAFGWATMIGLLRRGWRTDPAIHVMVGFAAAGLGAMYVFAHPGLSQTYFARTASPYLALLAAIGLAALVPAGARAFASGVPRRITGLTVGAAGLGLVAVIVVRATVGASRPTATSAHAIRAAVLPYAVLAVVLLIIAAAIVVAGRGLRIGRAPAVAAACIVVLVTAVWTGAVGAESMVKLVSSGAPLRNVAANPVSIPSGGIDAARWLRDHSATGDIVATNSHCRTDTGKCDSRDFWLAAYSERQIVVEGWSYTERSLETGLWSGELAGTPYWDQNLLAANDAVFTSPTAANVATFAQANHVRWLVAIGPAANPTLGRYATLAYHNGNVTVYRVTS